MYIYIVFCTTMVMAQIKQPSFPRTIDTFVVFPWSIYVFAWSIYVRIRDVGHIQGEPHRPGRKKTKRTLL